MPCGVCGVVIMPALLDAPAHSRCDRPDRPLAASMAEDIILETRGLTKEFKGFVAVSDVSLKVRRGRIHALIGPNGAGKTTCFNLLTHFLSPTRGQIFYNGRQITGSSPAAIARLGLVRSFQISAVFPHLTVLENVRIALQRKRGRSFDFWRTDRVLRDLNSRARELLDSVGLSEFEESIAVELPYGRKRALEIATTLALDPEMMLLDEPTAGMAHTDVERIAALIRRVAANRTVLMVEHNLGVGKTTTLKAIMGMVAHREGSIRFDGKQVVALSSDRIARLGVAFCPEERGIFASLNVHENLLLPPVVRAGGLSLDQVFELFPNLKERLASQGTKLSGGEQQMLAIGRILRTGARLLLLDEPTEGLAPVIVQQIGHTISRLKAEGFTILLVEQNFRFASRVADRHYVMESGRVVDMIPNAELESNLEKVHEYLGV